jgi:hypothetical protein
MGLEDNTLAGPRDERIPGESLYIKAYNMVERFVTEHNGPTIVLSKGPERTYDTHATELLRQIKDIDDGYLDGLDAGELEVARTFALVNALRLLAQNNPDKYAFDEESTSDKQVFSTVS